MTSQRSERLARILVVDDDDDVRCLVRAMLEGGPQAYEIQEASDGEEALRIAAESRPDLVLLDLVLTDVDGVTVLQALRRAPATRSTRVILVTAHSEERLVRASLLSGADEYLIKPVTQEKLVGVVERFLA